MLIYLPFREVLHSYSNVIKIYDFINSRWKQNISIVLPYANINVFIGLQTSENSKFYAISSRFKPFSNKGRSLVIQYTVKHEQKIDCGGGYVKIFSSNLDQKNMSGDSQYYIMFGEFSYMCIAKILSQ